MFARRDWKLIWPHNLATRLNLKILLTYKELVVQTTKWTIFLPYMCINLNTLRCLESTRQSAISQGSEPIARVEKMGQMSDPWHAHLSRSKCHSTLWDFFQASMHGLTRPFEVEECAYLFKMTVTLPDIVAPYRMLARSHFKILLSFLPLPQLPLSQGGMHSAGSVSSGEKGQRISREKRKKNQWTASAKCWTSTERKGCYWENH